MSFIPTQDFPMLSLRFSEILTKPKVSFLLTVSCPEYLVYSPGMAYVDAVASIQCLF